MARYYVNRNAQANGDHEVHKQGCAYMPDVKNMEYLGDFGNCRDAKAEAKKTYPTADGCYYCCNEAHKQ